MKDLIITSAEWKMLSIGQPFVGSMVITDSPQKATYKKVQWFDARKMTYQEAKQLASGLSYLGDCVMFDCFGQIAGYAHRIGLGACAIAGTDLY